jgi:hypothetical protein
MMLLPLLLRYLRIGTQTVTVTPIVLCSHRGLSGTVNDGIVDGGRTAYVGTADTVGRFGSPAVGNRVGSVTDRRGVRVVGTAVRLRTGLGVAVVGDGVLVPVRGLGCSAACGLGRDGGCVGRAFGRELDATTVVGVSVR